MADPHHIEALDALDRLTVVLYRAGVSLVALGVFFAGAGFAVDAPAPLHRLAFVVIALGTALSAVNLHLYDKRIRWVIQAAAALGLTLQASVGALGVAWSGAMDLIFWAGLGFQFVTVSGIALKEQFCFRIPGLRAAPLLLAASMGPLVFGWPVGSAVLLGLAGAILILLAVAKWRMPLHFDIGDRSRYQV